MADESMPLGPGFYMPCGAFFGADYMAAEHMFGCARCKAEHAPTSQDSAKPEHRCLDPRAGTLRLEGGRCFWCGEQVDPPAHGSGEGDR